MYVKGKLRASHQQKNPSAHDIQTTVRTFHVYNYLTNEYELKT